MDQSIMDSENMPFMTDPTSICVRPRRRRHRKTVRSSVNILCKRLFTALILPVAHRGIFVPPRRHDNLALYPFEVFNLAVFEPW